MRISYASSPGRICIIGEDMDWISESSILCAIDLQTLVSVRSLPTEQDNIKIRSTGSFEAEICLPLDKIGNYDGHKLDYVHASLKVLQKRGLQLSPIEISVESSLPAKAGLSSSAAVCSATIAAIGNFFDCKFTSLEIAHLAYLAEMEELKTGAGQMDPYSSCLGGMICITCDTVPPNKIETLNFPSGIGIIIIDTLTPRSTAEVISRKKNRYLHKEAGIVKYFKKMRILTPKVKKLLKESAPNPFILGNLINECHTSLRDDMCVSTPLIESCVEISMKNGAYGAKLTGTGMGGCVFAFVPLERISKVIESLNHLPVELYNTKHSTLGVWSKVKEYE